MSRSETSHRRRASCGSRARAVASTGRGRPRISPEPTDTEFFERAGLEDTRVGANDKDDPAEVAREGFTALMEGRERVVSASLSTRLQGRGSRLLPDRVKAAMHRRMAEPGSGDD